MKAYSDLRYRRQSSEIMLPFGSHKITHAALRLAEARFEEEFEREFAHRGEVKEFELATFRLVLSVARGAQTEGSDYQPPSKQEKPARDVYFGPDLGRRLIPVISRADLEGTRQGPVIIEEYDTTIVVPPGSAVRLDAAANIVMTLELE